MTLRCKPGDLALVIRGKQAGKTVTCVRLEDPPDHPEFKGRKYRNHGAIWLIDQELWWGLNDKAMIQIPYAADAYLMPIRPEPDEVETPAKKEVEA